MAALDYLKARGLSAQVHGNRVRVSPVEKLTPTDRQYIKRHRMELLAELAANDGIERRASWQVFRQGKPIATVVGVMTRAEALAASRFHWPDADVGHDGGAA